MEVRPGYKQTEVGVIPEEWALKPLGDVAEFLDGQRRPVKDSDRAKMRGDIPYYGASGIVDYVNDYLFDEDLILLGEDGENILSRNCRLAFKVSGKTWVNNHAHVLRPRAGMALHYLVEFLESRDYEQYNTGTAQPKLNKQVCSGIPVLCPPLPEQRAISAALSDADALLGGLDRLIAKKRDLKQAAMQQLLTGQTRLPGFSGDWVKTKFSEMCEYVDGVRTAGGDVGYVEIGDIDVERKSYSLSQKEKLSVPGAVKVPAGTLLISTVRPTRGAIAVTQSSLHVSSAFCRLRPANDLLFNLVCQPTFLAYLGENSIGGTYPTCRDETILDYETSLPGDSMEQTAIAAVLSDIDAELTALEARRDKTRALKQAMMQELLTGRTRLV